MTTEPRYTVSQIRAAMQHFYEKPDALTSRIEEATINHILAQLENNGPATTEPPQPPQPTNAILQTTLLAALDAMELSKSPFANERFISSLYQRLSSLTIQ